ncbi:MAG: VOC family protein [Novosphingobium sp.]|nr:VOC family protein [Novosphingobium sp.]
MTDFHTIPPRMSPIIDTRAPMFNGLYQMGFVTDDLDAAQERLGRRFGISRFRVQRNDQRMSTAHAFAGDMMVEIIQPGPEAPAVYHENVPGGGAVRLHHLGYRVPDVENWEKLLAQVDAEGWATPIRGAVMDGHLRFVYVDTLADLGIYQEYVCLTGPALHLYDDVPAN